MPEPRHIRANAALLIMALIWAANFSVAKIVLQRIPPLAFNALRFPLASVALYAILRARSRSPRPDRSDLWRLILLGLVGNFFYQQFFTFGLDHTRAGSASILIAGTPLITALLSALLGHERVHPRVWLGIGCTLIGIVIVVLFGQQHASDAASQDHTPLGAILLFAASTSWAFYTVGSRSLIKKYGALPVTAWTLWIGCVPLVLLGAYEAAQIEFAAVPPLTWAGLAYAGVISIAVAYSFWYYGVEQLGNTRTAVYSNLVPVLTLAIAWLWLAERPTLGQLAGAGVIIAGVSLAQSSNPG